MRTFLYTTPDGDSWMDYRNPRWLHWIETGALPLKHILHFVTDDYRGPLKRYAEITEVMVARWTQLGLIWLVDDSEYPDVDEYRISTEIVDEWDPREFSIADLDRLASFERMFNDSKGRRLTDTEACELINFALSAPEWSVSFLEDICEIIRRTGRSEVKGATWDRH